MIIGIDARFTGPEGTGLGKYTEKLINALEKIDKNNSYRIFLRRSNWSYLNFKNKNFIKILADVDWYSVREQIEMYKIFKSQNLDMLHVPHFNVPMFYKSKFVVTIHDLIHHDFTQESVSTKNFVIHKAKRIGYRIVFNNAINSSEKIIVPSFYIKNQLVKRFKVPEEKIIVTYEAAEEEYFTNNEVKKTRDLLYVGNIYPHKNIENLLLALKLLDKVKLTIVCPRNIFTKRLRSKILTYNLENRIEILPFQETKDLVRIFQTSKAYIFPSLSEGFGIPGLNAMAAKIPLLSSDIPTLKEVFGDAAIYFNPTKPNDIAQKILKITSDKKMAENLIEKEKKQVEKYDWKTMGEQTLKIYNTIS